MPTRIPLDPELPKAFHDTPNEERSKAQIDLWWDRPYGITTLDGRIEVHCLNGGAWDRPTLLGVAENFDAACALAETKQNEWQKLREKPRLLFDENEISVVRQPRRPDEDFQRLATFTTAEAAADYLRTNFPDTSSA